MQKSVDRCWLVTIKAEEGGCNRSGATSLSPGLALFKKFGWGAPVRAAAHEVFDLIVSKLDGGLSKASFGAIIDQMAGRKVLQSDNFLYITPRALHIRLWMDWWSQHGASIDLNELMPKLVAVPQVS